MTDSLIARLEEEMKKQGFNYKSLSRAAGLGETSVRDIITRRAQNPRRDTLQKIAATLGRPLSYFLSEEEGKVRLVGEIQSDMTLSRPLRQQVSEVTQSTEMIERVKGDALLPFMPSGTLIYYNEAGERSEDCLDQFCVIQVKNGPVMLRTMRRGLLYGTYHLEDYRGGVMENIEIEWCAKIQFIRLR